MTVITHARRQSRLAKMIDSAGGISVGVALAQARENIAALRDRALGEVTRHIDELSALEPPTGGLLATGDDPLARTKPRTPWSASTGRPPT